MQPSPREDRWAPTPGPVDRVTFFAEQRRHRRAFWWAAAVSLVGVLLMGLAISTVVSPVVILLSALAARLASLFVPLPPAVWEVFRGLADLLGGIKLALLDWRLSPDEIAPSLRAVALLLVPGVLAVVLLWITVCWLFLRAGVGGILLGLGARPPRAGDREERQLVNVVEEIAIAAGVRSPRVMLLDADVADAAVVGSSPDDATLVVTRRLLDELDRHETHGLLAHLIASIGNGDLEIVLTFLSVFQTFGLLMTMLDAPLSGRACGRLWRLLRLALFRFGRRTEHGAETEIVTAMLVGSLELDAVEDSVALVDATDRPSINAIHRGLLYLRFFLLLPLILLSLEAKLLLFLFTLFFLGPAIWWTLRARRHLADAMAVQLTRNPDGLAHGLLALSESGGESPGGEWGGPLFVAGGSLGRATGAQQFRSVRARLQPRLVSSAIHSGGEVPSAATETERRPGVGASGRETQTAGSSLFFMGAQPPLSSRLKRLRALGAAIEPVARKSSDAAQAPPADVRPTAVDAPADSNSNPVWAVVGYLLVAVIVVFLVWLLLQGIAFIVYLFAIGVMGAIFVVAGLFIVVMEIVVRILPP